MITLQIRFGDEDSCSYEYFETEVKNIKEVKKEATKVINDKYKERGIKSSPFSMGIYPYKSFLVREYDKKTHQRNKIGIIFTIKSSELEYIK